MELSDAGHMLHVPEITDYEVRRELLRIGNGEGIDRLDRFNKAEPGRYLPITTPVIRIAAAFWAESRKRGKQTSPDAALDADAIVAAQAYLLGKEVIVATDNVKHLSQFVRAEEWRNIRP